MRNPAVNGIYTEIPFFPSAPVCWRRRLRQPGSVRCKQLQVTEEVSIAYGAAEGMLAFPRLCGMVIKGFPPPPPPAE